VFFFPTLKKVQKNGRDTKEQVRLVTVGTGKKKPPGNKVPGGPQGLVEGGRGGKTNTKIAHKKPCFLREKAQTKTGGGARFPINRTHQKGPEKKNPGEEQGPHASEGKSKKTPLRRERAPGGNRGEKKAGC